MEKYTSMIRLRSMMMAVPSSPGSGGREGVRQSLPRQKLFRINFNNQFFLTDGWGLLPDLPDLFHEKDVPQFVRGYIFPHFAIINNGDKTRFFGNNYDESIRM